MNKEEQRKREEEYAIHLQEEIDKQMEAERAYFEAMEKEEVQKDEKNDV